MVDDAIILISGGIVLNFKSDSPLMTSRKKKTKCALYARQGELIFLHTHDRISFIRKLLNLALILVAGCVFFFSEELGINEKTTKILLYGGFGLYAILPKLLKTRAREMTPELLEQLDFEGELTRVYWRELLEVVPPARVKAAFMKPGELHQGYQTLLVTMGEEDFNQAIGIARGDYVDVAED